VVAEAAGASITRQELEERAAARLRRVRQQEYDARLEALEEMVAEKLLDKEAQSRGTTREALLSAEVDAKVADPTAAEIDAVYEQNRARLGGRSRDEVVPDIVRAIRQQTQAARGDAFRKELRKKSAVRILLDPPRSEVAIPADAPGLGPRDARVTIVEFSDYQCPYCRHAEPTVEQVLAQYEGKVRFVHRDFPLDGHPRALPAAQAARCAGEQGKFWEYHRALLGAAGDLGDADLKQRAASLALDPGRFATCLSSGRHERTVRQGLEDGVRLDVTGTPTFFVNGRMMVGARSLEQFQEVIDAELQGNR
jgi:protein-disulfide isomerase